ncbi:hypothetical protein [Dactylosporangium sp. NPDC005555]|uniref:hypothetical protein n=1 Tax=Dactylosporangium sp. NPDC005555 TaxID=3154889 RepID=UPI0033A5FCB6
MNQSASARGPVSLWHRAAACVSTALGRTPGLPLGLGLVFGLTLGLVLGTASPAAAHDGVILTLHGDGRGSVWVTADWQDGHPVTEAVGITLLATTADGRREGPAGLRRNGTALTYAGTLGAGDWTVVAEMGTPAIGRCQGVLHVGPDAAPQDIVCAPPSPAAAAPAPPAAPQASYAWVWYVSGVVLLGSGAAWLFYRRSATANRTGRGAKGRPSSRRTTSRRK